MARHVHIHLAAPTRDWEEGKHPRADNGQFGQGHGSPRKAPDPRAGPFKQAASERSGKSDYARARESEHDDRRDADYAKRLAEAKEKAAKEAAKKRPAREPKPKAEKPAPKPKQTPEQKAAGERNEKRRAARKALQAGNVKLAKQLLSEVRKVEAEVEREERKK